MPEARPVTGSHKDVRACGVYNALMILHGHFENGVVVLDGGTPLPDGTAVDVQPRPKSLFHYLPNRSRVEFPLVDSKTPGVMWNSPEELDELAYGWEIPS